MAVRSLQALQACFRETLLTEFKLPQPENQSPPPSNVHVSLLIAPGQAIHHFSFPHISQSPIFSCYVFVLRNNSEFSESSHSLFDETGPHLFKTLIQTLLHLMLIYIYKRGIGCVSVPDGHQLNLTWHIDSHYPWEGFRQVR